MIAGSTRPVAAGQAGEPEDHPEGQPEDRQELGP
jgi:hypothetical protein